MQFFFGHLVKRAHPALGEHAAEVLDVEGTGEALAAQDRVVVETFRHAAVAENVREKQLAARLQHAENLGEQLLFERREVYHAIRYDHIHARVGDAFHVLDEALQKLDVALRVAEALHVRVLETAREIELRDGHVDADDLALLAHELAGDVDVAPRAAAQIEHRGALERGRQGRAAAVEVLDHFRLDVF